MQLQQIITHPGSAHFDDMTAVSLLLAAYPEVAFKIERREPTLAELENPRIWVLDIGNRLEPEKRNFDHHQSLDIQAAFVLVARHLGLVESLSVAPWWNYKDSEDRIGPVKSAQIYQSGDVLVNHNPIEDWLIGEFALRPQASLPLLRAYGTHMISNARRLKTQIEFWKRSRRLVIAGLPAVFGETRESLGMDEFRRLDPNPPDIVISFDRRSDGWRLFRYEGVPVDFTLIAEAPEIAFAHKSGFMATTRKRLSLDQLNALISRAVTREVI
jgi:hypothetical protein